MVAAGQPFKVQEVAGATQTQPLRVGTEPSHLGLAFLGQVVADAQVLAEIFHGSLHGETGLIESDHSHTIAKRHKKSSTLDEFNLGKG